MATAPDHVPDQPYRQEVRAFYTAADGLPTDRIRGLATTADGALWAGTELGLMRYHSGRWEQAGQANPEAALALCCLWGGGSELWTGTSSGVSRLAGGQWTHWWWDDGAPTRSMRHMAGDGRALWVRCEPWDSPGATPDQRELWRFDGERWQAFDQGEQPLVALAVRAGEVWAASRRQLFRLTPTGPSQQLLPLPPEMADAAFTGLAGNQAGLLAIATDRGVLLLQPDGKLTVLQSKQGLPVEDTSLVALGPAGDLWVGDRQGLARRRDGRWRYFSVGRWLPAAPDCVRIDEQGGAWVATSCGLAHLGTRRYTLATKAEHFARQMRDRHWRDGWACPIILSDPRHTARPFVQAASGSDGLHTGMQLGALSLRYALSRHPDHLELCHRSFGALLRQERLTGRPGLVARCALHRGAPCYPTSGEWHHSAVDPHWYWQGDASGDELDGQLSGYALYADLVAVGDCRAEAAAVVGRIVRGIIEHGYRLIDADGEPTRWGVWSPDRLRVPLAPRRRLGALEMLTYCKIAEHLTGEPLFSDSYRELIERHGYLDLATEAPVSRRPGEGRWWESELVFLSYYHLCRYETAPDLRSRLLAALAIEWETQRITANPLYNLIYGACSGQPCDAEVAADALRDAPLDQRNLAVRNSHRADLAEAVAGGPSRPAPLSWHERPGLDCEDDPWRLDGDGDGRSEGCTHWWLLAYWLGRYHGLIGPDLTGQEPSPSQSGSLTK